MLCESFEIIHKKRSQVNWIPWKLSPQSKKKGYEIKKFEENQWKGHNMILKLFEILFLKSLLTGCFPFELSILRKTIVIDIEFNMLTGLNSVKPLIFAENWLYMDKYQKWCFY